jgi:hypothetical protein
LLADIASGTCSSTGQPPASVSVLSGDVHHAYAAQAHFPTPVSAPVFQLVCSPLHNYVPAPMKATFRVAWSRVAERSVRRLLGLVTEVPPTSVTWERLFGPFFGSDVATLTITERQAEMLLQRAAAHDDPAELLDVAQLQLV